MNAPIYTSKLLDKAGVRHGFTTRLLGDVLADLSGWERESGLSPSALVSLCQVHGSDVLWVDRPAAEVLPEERRRFDASVTDRHDVVLGVRTADCVPLLFFCARPRAAAAAHAGWRGTLSGTVRGVVSSLHAAFGCDPANLQVAIGPSIRACCYRVGPDVFAPFLETFGPRVAMAFGRELRVDLVEANRTMLLESGVPAENLDVLDLCTHCRGDLFFSHRRDGPTGRHLAYIALSDGRNP